MTGWIRLDRKVFECSDFADEPMTRREAWIKLLTMVDYETGSGNFSRSYLQKSFNWTPKKVRCFLQFLGAKGMAQIEAKSGTKDSSTITIVKWGQYQDRSRHWDQGKGQDGGQEEGHNITKETTETIKQKKVSKKTRLPADWTIPFDWIDYGVSKGMTQETAYREAEKFAAHHHGKGSLQLDWKATWRTWVLNGYWKKDLPKTNQFVKEETPLQKVLRERREAEQKDRLL